MQSAPPSVHSTALESPGSLPAVEASRLRVNSPLEPAPLSDGLPPEAELPPPEAELPALAYECTSAFVALPPLHAVEPTPPRRTTAPIPAIPRFKFRIFISARG